MYGVLQRSWVAAAKSNAHLLGQVGTTTDAEDAVPVSLMDVDRTTVSLPMRTGWMANAASALLCHPEDASPSSAHLTWLKVPSWCVASARYAVPTRVAIVPQVSGAGITIQALLQMVVGAPLLVLLRTHSTVRRANVRLLCLLVLLGTMADAKDVQTTVLTAVATPVAT